MPRALVAKRRCVKSAVSEAWTGNGLRGISVVVIDGPASGAVSQAIRLELGLRGRILPERPSRFNADTEADDDEKALSVHLNGSPQGSSPSPFCTAINSRDYCPEICRFNSRFRIIIIILLKRLILLLPLLQQQQKQLLLVAYFYYYYFYHRYCGFFWATT